MEKDRGDRERHIRDTFVPVTHNPYYTLVSAPGGAMTDEKIREEFIKDPDPAVRYTLGKLSLVSGQAVIEGHVTEIKTWGSMTRQWVGSYQPDDAGMSWTYSANIPCDFVIRQPEAQAVLKDGTVGVVAEVSRRLATALNVELQRVVIEHSKRLDAEEEVEEEIKEKNVKQANPGSRAY